MRILRDDDGFGITSLLVAPHLAEAEPTIH